MKVWRVEHFQDKRGPYRPGLTKLWAEGGHEERNPYIHIEFPGLRSLLALAHSMGENTQCGFRTSDQLKAWFNDAELLSLAALGFLPKQVKARRIIVESERQLVFVRARL